MESYEGEMKTVLVAAIFVLFFSPFYCASTESGHGTTSGMPKPTQQTNETSTGYSDTKTLPVNDYEYMYSNPVWIVLVTVGGIFGCVGMSLSLYMMYLYRNRSYNTRYGRLRATHGVGNRVTDILPLKPGVV